MPQELRSTQAVAKAVGATSSKGFFSVKEGQIMEYVGEASIGVQGRS